MGVDMKSGSTQHSAYLEIENHTQQCEPNKY